MAQYVVALTQKITRLFVVEAEDENAAGYAAWQGKARLISESEDTDESYVIPADQDMQERPTVTARYIERED